MSFNPNFYNNFTTFQNNVGPPRFTVPPPPLPPLAQPFSRQNGKPSDLNIVQMFEAKITHHKTQKPKKTQVTISQARQQLRDIVTRLNNLKDKETSLQEKVETLSEPEWKETMESMVKEKELIENSMVQINDTYLDTIKNALAKRSAKRLRLKRVKSERKREKMERQRQWEEMGRKIDENLQKIKDDIDKAKQEEESKAQADIVLREVSRKKQDAKKCIAKLEAMAKLRKARENTAKGRGEAVSEIDANAFNSNIEKIKSLWLQKLALYDKEETVLRAKLSSDAQTPTPASEAELKVTENLDRWREHLFGSPRAGPQVDFRGDAGRFVAVRYAWDQYISSEGSPLPVGWVLPE